MSAYQHGINAWRRRKHVQANPYDYMTDAWREWRLGYYSLVNAPWTSYDYNSSR